MARASEVRAKHDRGLLADLADLAARLYSLYLFNFLNWPTKFDPTTPSPAHPKRMLNCPRPQRPRHMSIFNAIGTDQGIDDDMGHSFCGYFLGWFHGQQRRTTHLGNTHISIACNCLLQSTSTCHLRFWFPATTCQSLQLFEESLPSPFDVLWGQRTACGWTGPTCPCALRICVSGNELAEWATSWFKMYVRYVR